MSKKNQKLIFAAAFVILGIAAFFLLSGNASKGLYSMPAIPAPSLANNLLGDPTTQSITVYLPKSYEKTDKRYPVVYFLPGFCDSYAFYGNELNKSMNFMLGQKKINEMIVVTVNGMNKLHGSYYVNSPVTGNWEDFVVRDVVKYVDQNYRTIPKAESRGIAGHSMGDFGSLNIAMRHPDVFSSVYSMSPGLFDKYGLSKVDFDFAKENPYAALAPENARDNYLENIKTMKYPDDFSHAYGSAFSPDPGGKAPYIKFVGQGLTPEQQRQDPTWQAWNNGFGNWEEKVKHNKDNLSKLKAIAIDYGRQDNYQWIPDGIQHFSQLLTNENIPHEVLSYDGDHMSRVLARIEEHMLPYFSKNLAFE